MAEASNIRLVRCPKCRNLLREPPDHSVYLCGGCDAVLTAKKKSSASDEFLVKSNEDDNVDGYKKLETLSEKVSGRLDSLSGAERERDGVELSRRKDRVPVEENVNLAGVSSTGTKNKEILISHDDVNVRVKSKGLRVDQGKVEREVRFGDKRSRRSMKKPIDEWVGGDDHDLNWNRSKSVSSNVVKGIGENSSQFRNSAEDTRSRVVLGRWGVEREGFWGFDEDPRTTVPEHSRFSPSAYPDEGPSNRKPNSFYGYGEPMKKLVYPDHKPYRVENLEQDRAEIIRKLNDLKKQISRLDEKPKGTIPDDRKTARPESYRSEVTYNVPGQPFEVNRVLRPPNLNHSHVPASFANDHNLDVHNFYPPPRHVPNMISGSIYEQPFRSQQLTRPRNQPPTRYPQQPHHDYYLGQSVNFDQDLLASHSQETFLHQPACSCLHCYNRNSQFPPKVPDIGFTNRKFVKYPTRSNYYHNVNPVTVGRQNYHPSGVIPPPLHSQDLQPCTRWPIDIDSDVDGFRQSCPRRVVVAHGNKKFSHPIVGGAPFMTCCKCFELLKLPRKLIKTAKNQKKLQCGACSTVHSFEMKDKRLIISVLTETKQLSVKNGGILSSHGCPNDGGTNSCSVDFDHSGLNCQSVDTKPNLLLEDQMLNLNESEKRQGHTSSSSVSSEKEESPNSVIVQRGMSNCAEMPSKDDTSPSVAGSPFSDHFNGSSSICAVSSIGKGNRSKCTDQETVIFNKVASGKNSEKDASLETEVEVSSREYASLSQNSIHVSREEDQTRIKTGHKTSLAGLVNKSFRGFSIYNQPMENVRPNVSVNGQPIPDHLVKKAEQLAGPIHPGNYWYDFRAGFWGVMGQPCCGIISPFIEEFNYSMPESCAAGNTGVFVNGRELHPTDLDLLVSKGLPKTRNKNYIIEISGRVVDEDSGKELDSLGKLAPTVEKVKRGFGMRAPKDAS
ncbi:hypothetical protein ACOSQ2_024934 [Xanthoceras sorbifolium]